MRVKKLSMLACVVLLSYVLRAQVPPAFGQGPFQLRTEVGMRINGGLGLKNPEFSVAVTPELNVKRLYVRTSAFYRTGNKIGTGDGHSAGGEAEAYFRINRFLFGGGVNYGKLTTSLYHKSNVRPLIGGAVEFKIDRYPARLFGQYVLRGSDDLNGLQGFRTRLEVEINRRVRFMPYSLGIYRFFPTNAPQLGTRAGFAYSFGVSYLLGPQKERSAH